MGRECGSCGGRGSVPFRVPSSGGPVDPNATQAGSTVQQFEVLDGAGRGTGRKFSSLIAATSYAKRLGGSTRPV